MKPEQSPAPDAASFVKYWVMHQPDGHVVLGWPGAGGELVLSPSEAAALAKLLRSTSQELSGW